MHSFGGGADGVTPDSPLIQVGNALFGTTAYGPGGTNGGIVFKIDLATGTESVVFRFTKLAEGQLPVGFLVLVNGLIYGTTNNGGSHNFGTIYTIDPVSGAHNVVYDFTGGTSDYGGPVYGLLYQDGVFYGTTGSFGKTPRCGTAFSYVP